MKSHILFKTVLIFSLTALFSDFGFHASAQSTVITNVHVVDVKKGRLLESRDVLIRGNKIEQISKHDAGKTWGSEVKTIEGNAGYLAPGFIETHAHFGLGTVSVEVEDYKPVVVLNLIESLPKITANLLLGHGVTTARDPGGNTETTVKTKRMIARGQLDGPELFVAGNILDTVAFKNLTDVVRSQEEVRAAVRAQKAAGVDIVKLYTSLSPDLLRAGIDEARKVGLKSTAHLHTTPWTTAAQLGINNIVHIIPGSDTYIPSDKRAEYNRVFGTRAFFKWFELVDLDGPEIKEMIKALKRNGVSIDPTLIPFHAAFFGNEGTYQANDMLKYVPENMLKNWQTSFNFNIGWSKEDFLISNAVWPKVQRFTKMLHDNGIVLTAGTDANNPWVVPGDSFHGELELLAACGISNADVLKIATLNGAKIMDLDNRIGSIEKDKEADLVLLTRNPLEDISATRSIRMIMNNGKQVDSKQMIEASTQN